jgi:glycosyltransferase involved in cell wall biosynthesis
VTSPDTVGASIDDAAASAFAAEYPDDSRRLPPVAIVIAAYNEEGAIGPVIDGLPGSICGLSAVPIVVVDGSVDATATEARAHGALVCDVPVNRGQGAALRLGYRLAREGGASYIVTTDADGQYNPAEMDRILAPVVSGEADFATGSRRLGSEETRDPVRRLGVRVFALTISVLTGQRISDTTFGLRAMRAEVTAAVRLQQPQYQAAELLISVIANGFRVKELPATIHRRRVGKSKKGHNAIYALRFSGVILRTWWRDRIRRAGGGAAPGRQRAADASGNLSSAGTSRDPRRGSPDGLPSGDGAPGTGPSGVGAEGFAATAVASPDAAAPTVRRSAKRT